MGEGIEFRTANPDRLVPLASSIALQAGGCTEPQIREIR